MRQQVYQGDVRMSALTFKNFNVPAGPTNNVSAKFNIHNDYILLTRVFFSTKIYFKDVQEIGIYLVGRKISWINVTTNNSIFKYFSSFRSRAQLRDFLIILKNRGCPLSPDAILFLKNTSHNI